MDAKICWVDVETTGTDPQRHDIWQLGALIEINGEVVDQVELKMRPTSEATDLPPEMRLDPRMLKKLPLLKTSLEKLKKALRRHVEKYKKDDKFVFAGYNVDFDYDFLRSSFTKTGDRYFGSWFFWPTIDVKTLVGLAIGRCGFRAPNYKLSTVCGMFGIAIDAHTAISDIIATRELYLRLRDGVLINTKGGRK